MIGTLTFYLIHAFIYFLSRKCRELWQEVLVFHFPWLFINYLWMTSSEGLGESSKSGNKILLHHTQWQVTYATKFCCVRLKVLNSTGCVMFCHKYVFNIKYVYSLQNWLQVGVSQQGAAGSSNPDTLDTPHIQQSQCLLHLWLSSIYSS